MLRLLRDLRVGSGAGGRDCSLDFSIKGIVTLTRCSPYRPSRPIHFTREGVSREVDTEGSARAMLTAALNGDEAAPLRGDETAPLIVV